MGVGLYDAKTGPLRVSTRVSWMLQLTSTFLPLTSPVTPCASARHGMPVCWSRRCL